MDSERKETFGEWLKRLREERGLSLDEIGEAMRPKRTGGYIHQLERGTKHGTSGSPPKPRPATCKAIARVLGVSVEEVYYRLGYTDKIPEVPKNHRILKLWDRYGEIETQHNIELSDNLIDALTRQLEEIKRREDIERKRN